MFHYATVASGDSHTQFVINRRAGACLFGESSLDIGPNVSRPPMRSLRVLPPPPAKGVRSSFDCNKNG
jgi:hypothetical protein